MRGDLPDLPALPGEDVERLMAAFMGLGFCTGAAFMSPDGPARDAAKASLEANASLWADCCLWAAVAFEDEDLSAALREAAETLHGYAAR